MPVLVRRALAEYAGTAMLVAVVVGSGVMGASLSHDPAVALVLNALSTILALALLIAILAPVTGAHLNPVVSLLAMVTRTQRGPEACAFIVAQISGAITGAVVANVMFDLPALQTSVHHRVSTGTLIGEVIATAGLVLVIEVFVSRGQAKMLPIAVAAWIGSAYFFTSSTSFANPAVTVGRMFTDTFAGIAPDSVLPFLGAQLVGASLGAAAARTFEKV